MNEHGGTPISSASTSLVVTLGGGSPGGAWPGGDAALDGPGLRRHLETVSAAKEHARLERVQSLGRRSQDLAARRDELVAERERRRAEHAGSAERVAAESAAVEAVVERRHERLASLEAAVATLRDAMEEWRRILDQQGAAEVALDGLSARVGTDDAPLSPEHVVGEMQEGEAVLQRSEVARRETVDAAVAAVTEAAEAIRAETEPLRFGGLLRLRSALDDLGATAADDDLEQRVVTLAAEQDEVAAEMAQGDGLEGHGDDTVALVLAALEDLEGDPVVVDDVLSDVGDEDTAAILAGLPSRFTDRRLVYLTGDVRVLSWAIGLPPHLGGITGAIDSSTRSE